MNDKRREILLGYLLGALEPQESAKVDEELHTNVALREDLAAICREISPINEIVDDHEPPVGLASRTCHKIWTEIDSEQKSLIDNALTDLPISRKNRRITVVLSQNEKPQEEVSLLQPHFSIQDETESHDLNTDAVIPLSQALQVGTSGKPRKPNEILRRVDSAANTSKEPHLYYADSMEIVKRHPPKYYGREKKGEKVVTPWTVRDVFASLMVGLTAAVVIFPLIQMGLGSFRDMIIQKKLETVAGSMAPSTSQYSLNGFSPNDLRVLAGMNLDTQSAGELHSLQNNSAFTGLQEYATPSSPAPVIFPVGLSGRSSDASNSP